MVTAIVIFFILGYLCIALESVLKINKAVPALLMCVVCWTLYACGAAPDDVDTSSRLLHHLGETCEILFFLMGAMTIVEIVDANGGFYFVQDVLSTRSKRALLWRITFMTFILSAILDNLTTSIVMVMVLRKLAADPKDRMLFGGMIIIAANAGGAFSPIGDVTTIMLWIKGMISTGGVISQLLAPSLIAVVVSALCTSLYLKGELQAPERNVAPGQANNPDRMLILCVGVGGLVFVPIFRMLTGLAPFMGILLALGVLWLVSEYRCNRHALFCESSHLKVTTLLSRIDMATILFFLGILLAVATLQETGVLSAFGKWLNEASDGNHYLVTGIIGVVSSIVDNVPAAGVVVMGLEKIGFGWYLRRFTWIAFVGYVSGIGVYAIEHMLFM